MRFISWFASRYLYDKSAALITFKYLFLKLKVSEEEICYSKPSYVIPENLKFPSSKVLAVMKSNLDVKHLQFQYIGLNSGLYINYPATKLTDCDTYDPRFRYVKYCCPSV